MSWIIIVLIIIGVIWLVKRNRNRTQQPNQTQIPQQNMPQNHPEGGFGRASGPNNPQQSRPLGAGNRQCPYCTRAVGNQETLCPSCGAKLPLPPRPATPVQDGNPVQGRHPVMGRGQNTQTGETHVQEGRGGSMLGDAVKTGAAVIATQAILGGLMGQGQAQAGNQMPPDPSMMPDDDYPDDTGSPFPGMGAGGNNPFGGILGNGDEGDSPFGNVMGNGDNPFFGNGTDQDTPLPGGFDNGLGALSNLGGSDDSNNAAGWITDENDTGSNGGWLSSGNDDNSSWSLGSNDDDNSGGNWFSNDDDSGSGSSWSFGSDDNDSGSSWSFDDDD